MSIGEGLGDQAYFGTLGDEWWNPWEGEPAPAAGAGTSIFIEKPEPADGGGQLTPSEIAILNDPAGRTGFEMPDTWPSDLHAAVSQSTIDVLRSLPYAISQDEAATLITAAQAAIHESAVTGQPVDDTWAKWASVLPDIARKILPQIINRAMGMGTQPAPAARPAAPATTAGFDPKWWILGGLGALVLVSMARGRRTGYARAAVRRRPPVRRRRAPAGRRR